MKRGPVIAFIVLVAAAAFTFVSFSGATARHVTIRQAKAMSGQMVQVPGRIEKDTVSFDLSGENGHLSFDISDIEGSGDRLKVVYAGAKPENFANATTVEAVGMYRDGAFRAQRLLVKCPSRYQAVEENTSTQTADRN